MESKESIEVSVKETPDEPVQFIKDFGVSLNTGMSGVAEFITPVINGKLDAVLVSSDKQVGVSISFEPFDDIVLWKDVSFAGRKYLPLRVQPVHNDGLVLRNDHTKWSLNNALRMKVKGPQNATVNFIVRYY